MPSTFGGLAFPKRSSAVTAMASARGMEIVCAPAGRIFTVRQVPLDFACTAIFAALPSADQRMRVLAPSTAALAPGEPGALLLSHGIGGMAAGWV